MRDNGWVYAAAGLGTMYLGHLLLASIREEGVRNKAVLITGGSRGLGLSLAREFCIRGGRVAICARDAAELDRAREQLTRQGHHVITAVCDLADPRQIETMLDDLDEKLGPLEVLVNNAGIIQVGPVEEMVLEDYRAAMDIHFWSPLHAILHVMPGMIRRGSGRIVNITSIGGKIGVPHLVPYCASKFALVGLSEALRPELAKYRIAVTTVVPGLMRTGSPRNAFFKGHNRAEYTWFSISDALPVLSMNAERAARQIVRACIRGDAEVVLSMPAKVAVRFHGLFPGVTQEILELVNYMLPGPGGIGKESAPGRESSSRLSPSWLTTLGEEAARAHNEIP